MREVAVGFGAYGSMGRQGRRRAESSAASSSGVGGTQVQILVWPDFKATKVMDIEVSCRGDVTTTATSYYTYSATMFNVS
jgi:hypothetical protein